jgi:signal peptidase I
VTSADPRVSPGATSTPAPARRPRWAGVVVLTVVCVLVLLVLRATVAAPLRVSSDSMRPTYEAGDVVLVSRSVPRLAGLSRGDLVVFRSPEDGRPTLKRVVGLPGEEVVVLDSVLHVDGRPVAEPYVDHPLIDGYYSRTYRVPAGAVFVMGDNRGNSVDSRDYGPVDQERLVGTVLGRVWPPVTDRPTPRPPKP